MSRWQTVMTGLFLLFCVAACTNSTESRSNDGSQRSSSSGQIAGQCEHHLPSTLCTRCNPALAAVFQAKGDWCEEHGFPESFCPICRPGAHVPQVDGEATTPAVDWCVGHELPESKCTKCNPELIAEFKEAGDWCEAHQFPESACPICNQQAPPSKREVDAIEARVVRFASPDIEKKVGLVTAPARRVAASDTISCTARIAFDHDRVADIRAIVPGVVRRLRVELGEAVEQGAPLFDLESTRVGEFQGALKTSRERVRTAKANLARKRELRADHIASARQVEVAEQELATAQTEARAAEATLRMIGAARSDPSGRYTLTSPLAGTVIRRPAMIGALATEGTSLATVADTSMMWALCEVPDRDAARLVLGQQMMVEVDGSSAEPLQGDITWISAEVDPRTRTVTARAEVQNPDGHLRVNQFARAQIELGARREAVAVPRSAIQRVGDLEVVFVRARAGTYQPRVVQRHGEGDPVQVEGRLSEGEAVVTTGAILLRTEVIPGSIGAGCCEVE